jgi:hypothetical protein
MAKKEIVAKLKKCAKKIHKAQAELIAASKTKDPVRKKSIEDAANMRIVEAEGRIWEIVMSL